MLDRDKAQTVFEDVMIWPVSRAPVPLPCLLEGLTGPDRDFVEAAWNLSDSLYSKMPPRKNRDPAFTHPTHVAWFLKQAACQPHVIAAGLLHDYLEDKLELDHGKVRDPAVLDRLVGGIRAELATAVIDASVRTGFVRYVAERVVQVVWTLTRHKAELYYKSISAVFNNEDESVRLAGALVKLADRMHNIQTIENYPEPDKLYQCFKNIFILNNAKQLRALLGEKTRAPDQRMVRSLSKLYKKSGKATFQALLRIQHEARACDPVFELVTYLALALKKFTLEVQGLWKVAHPDLGPGAPIYNLYHGIVEKYDHWLHHEMPEYDAHVARELEYCGKTFGSLGLSPADLERAIAFKDAMVLAEVVASLLYFDTYVIRGFECGSLCRRGRNCLKAQGAAAGGG
ncbi:MAG: HD domain-containing protein [Deltaproteobacteria bacterium]|nr:HD domain-containing protein [Deltaproteobacteria bacterium]